MARKIAIIKDGAVANVVVSDAARGPDQVDITGQHVGRGWLWNGITFSEPPAPVAPTPKLSAADLIEVLTTEEQDAILESTDPKVKAFIEKLMMFSSAGIHIPANQALVSKLSYLVSKGLLTQARVGEMLAELGVT